MIKSKCDPKAFCRVLAAHPVSINDAASNHQTLLMVAASAGHIVLVKYICRHLPVIVNLGDHRGRTAAYYAAQHQDQRVAIAMLQTLFDKGANFNIAARVDGAPTPLQASRRKKLFATATYLYSKGALGPFEETQRSIRPNLVLDDDELTEEMSGENEADENHENKKQKLA